MKSQLGLAQALLGLLPCSVVANQTEAEGKFNADLRLRAEQYAYLAQVNDIFSRRRDLGGHLLNLSHGLNEKHSLGAYAYLLDFDPGMGSDHATYGLRLNGTLHKSESVASHYQLEYAVQKDHADAPSTVDADYWHLQADLDWAVVKLTGGFESLGGDGVYAFSTPVVNAV